MPTVNYHPKYIIIRSLFLLSFLFCVSCISRPDYVLDEDKMVDLLIDVHRSEGLFELQQNTSQSNTEEYKQQVIAAVLVKRGVTRAQYDSSLVWYGANLQYLIKVYNKVQKKIGEEIDFWTEQDLLSRNEFALSEAGDSVQLWSIEDYQIFDESRLASYRFWEIKSDSNYMPGDSISWKIHVPQVPDSHYLVASLSLIYKDETRVDSVPISQTTVIRRDTTVNLSCVANPSKVFDSMLASIILQKDSMDVADTYAFVDSLSLVRIHKTNE